MKKKILFPLSVFIAGLCSIIYELLISTAATYFLGDGVKQFSIIIGIYLFSMGIGAYLSKYFQEKSLFFFVKIEYVLGLIGGISVPLIYYLFVTVSPEILQVSCLAIVFFIGLLTGMEVPLLTFAKEDNVKDNLSNILSLDYIGGLVATLIFPFLLLPFVGLFYSSLIFGIINILLGISLNLIYFGKFKKNLIVGVVFIFTLLGLVYFAGNLLKAWDDQIYKNPIVYNEQTPYQKIVLTKRPHDIRLYLNRVIQFSSKDEHRYHESLVHVPLLFHPNPQKVLILGGGENLASREVLKHEDIERIDVVDIDEAMFDLAKTNRYLTHINQNAALNLKVNLIAEDAFTFLKKNATLYDVIISDLPDPQNEAIARLYSKQFFLMINRSLDNSGVFVTQAGEIYYSNTVFSCINNTLKEVFGNVIPYHTYIPSFGDWGFLLASKSDLNAVQNKPLPQNLKFLTKNQMEISFLLPKDVSLIKTKINTLDSPIILNYYVEDWERWKMDFANNPAWRTD